MGGTSGKLNLSRSRKIPSKDNNVTVAEKNENIPTAEVEASADGEEVIRSEVVAPVEKNQIELKIEKDETESKSNECNASEKPDNADNDGNVANTELANQETELESSQRDEKQPKEVGKQSLASGKKRSVVHWLQKKVSFRRDGRTTKISLEGGKETESQATRLGEQDETCVLTEVSVLKDDQIVPEVQPETDATACRTNEEALPAEVQAEEKQETQKHQEQMQESVPGIKQEEVQEPTSQMEQEEVQEPTSQMEQEEVQEPTSQTEQEQVQETTPEFVQEQVQEPTPKFVQEQAQEPTPEFRQEQAQEPTPEIGEEQVQEPNPEVRQEQVQEETLELSQDQVQEPTPVVETEELKQTVPDAPSEMEQDQFEHNEKNGYQTGNVESSKTNDQHEENTDLPETPGKSVELLHSIENYHNGHVDGTATETPLVEAVTVYSD